MEYKLFTFPNCNHCTSIKEYLDERKIVYEEINIGSRTGKKSSVWKTVYGTQGLEANENGLILPILAEINEGKLERVAQNEEIKQIFD
jgi:hypothetical protein